MRILIDALRAAVIAVSVILVAGCADPSGSGAGGSVFADDLDGQAFVGGTVVASGDSRGVVEGTRLSLEFDGDSLSTGAGCNQMSGRFAVEDGRLVLPEGLSSTEMACEPALMEQETWWAGFLASAPELTLTDPRLTLRTADARVDMTNLDVAQPQAELTGTLWTLDGIIEGESVSSVPDDVTSTLRLDGSGTAEVETGCNTGWADVRIGKGSLEFGTLGLTLVLCADPVAEIEAAVLAVLEGEVAYSLRRQSLILTRNGTGLLYRAP